MTSLAAFAALAAVFMNSDAWNFWTDNALEGRSREELVAAVEADVDFYADAGATAILYNMNAQRALFPSKAATPFWKDVAEGEDGRLLLRGKPLATDQDETAWRKMAARARHVAEILPDFMRVRLARCRARKVEMWHSMRMNDVHYTYLGNEWAPLHSDMWLDRKDLLRAWYRHSWRCEWSDNGFDYAKKEVFDAALALVREYLLDYESDGIELDWMRCLPVFVPGNDESNAPILTRFMRETRRVAAEAAAKWGHPVRVGVRVPARVREACGAGIDIASWAREGLVDLVVPSPKDTSTEMDCDVALYRALCPRPIILAPDLDYDCRSDATHDVKFCAEIDRGFLSGWYHDGADAAYLYNHFPRHAGKGHRGYPAYVTALGDRAAVARLPRRHVFTRHVPVGEGRFPRSPYWSVVWKNGSNGSVKVNCGEGVAGRRAKVVVGVKGPFEGDILVNAAKCTDVEILSGGEADGLPKPLPRVVESSFRLGYVVADVPLGVLHDGWNAVEIFNRGARDLSADCFLWLEIMLY